MLFVGWLRKRRLIRKLCRKIIHEPSNAILDRQKSVFVNLAKNRSSQTRNFSNRKICRKTSNRIYSKRLLKLLLQHFSVEQLNILMTSLFDDDQPSSTQIGRCIVLKVEDVISDVRVSATIRQFFMYRNVRTSIPHLLREFMIRICLVGIGNFADNYKTKDGGVSILQLPWCTTTQDGLICLNPTHYALSHSTNRKLMINLNINNYRSVP